MEGHPNTGDASNPVDRSVDGTAYEEPQGMVEQAIATLWSEVFGFGRIGRNDNFFELGGDSVLGMQLVELLAKRMDIQLPVVTVYLNPTIRELTALATPPSLPQ